MVRVVLNSKGIDEVLRSADVKRAVDKLAEQVADNARDSAPDVVGVPGEIPLPVKVNSYETDRARAEVWLAHPSGLAVQAKHGLLTRAASEAGVEVKSS